MIIGSWKTKNIEFSAYLKKLAEDAEDDIVKATATKMPSLNVKQVYSFGEDGIITLSFDEDSLRDAAENFRIEFLDNYTKACTDYYLKIAEENSGGDEQIQAAWNIIDKVAAAEKEALENNFSIEALRTEVEIKYEVADGKIYVAETERNITHNDYLTYEMTPSAIVLTGSYGQGEQIFGTDSEEEFGDAFIFPFVLYRD